MEEKYPQRIFQTLDLNLLGTCKYSRYGIVCYYFWLEFGIKGPENQCLAGTPLQEAFSSSGRLTGDWLSRVSNFVHLHIVSLRIHPTELVMKILNSFLTCSFPSQPHGWLEGVGHRGFGGRPTVAKKWHGSHSVQKSAVAQCSLACIKKTLFFQIKKYQKWYTIDALGAILTI